jgi:hypothetical protein
MCATVTSRGHRDARQWAACNRAIMRHWREHPDAAADYEAQKYRHCHSKREYYRWKDGYIADILESLQGVSDD